MTVSRQFRALLKLAGLWAIPWTAIGVAVAVFRWVASGRVPPIEQPLAAWILLHALAYGTLGLLSGLNVGLLLARLERGRRVDNLSTRRVALWSAIGGAMPPALFAGLGLVFGPPGIVYVPLLALGVAGAVISAGLATSTLAAAKRVALPNEPDPPRLRSTDPHHPSPR